MVEISKDELAARCTVCFKYLHYRKQVRWEMWREMLRSFQRQHLNCKGRL
jgi:hypothetical protein